MPDAKSPPQVLFVTSNRIGDCVISSGVIREIGRQLPDARITVASGRPPAPLFRAALDSHAAHLALQLLALAAGALIALAVRLAPAPRRGWVAAVPLLLGAAGGIALRSTERLLAASWFGATGRTWRADALADQQSAGTLVLVVVVLVALVAGGVALRIRGRRG